MGGVGGGRGAELGESMQAPGWPGLQSKPCLEEEEEEGKNSYSSRSSSSSCSGNIRSIGSSERRLGLLSKLISRW